MSKLFASLNLNISITIISYIVFLLTASPLAIQQTSLVPMSDSVLSASLGETVSMPNRVLVTPDTYGSVLLGFPDLVSEK